MKPVSFKDALIYGSANSNVAVCTLWSEKARVAEHLDKNDYALLGNLYSNAGVNAIIRNVLANPGIRFIVLFGDDLSKSGDCLKAFFEKGADEQNFIHNTKTKIEEEISKEAVDSFRKNVSLIDLRKKSVDELKKELKRLNEKRLLAFAEPQIFPESKKTATQLESESTGFIVRGKTIAATWLKLLDLTLKLGVEKPTEYGVKQKELLNITAVIDEKDESLAEFFNFTDKDLREYMPSILTPFKPAKVSYTYGSRLFKKEDKINISQMENAIEKLKRCPYTRRAIAFTWRIEQDSESESPPCLTQLLWSIQNNRLLQTVHFRSHDLFEAWPMNLFALKELQELIGKELNIEPGPLTCISHSAHIYEPKWEETQKIISKYYKADYEAMELDPRGNFRIWIESEKVGDKKIVVEHIDKEGNKTGHIFEGSNAKKIITEILHENLVSRLDHAAYLGKELERAEKAIKENKNYEQDKV